MFFSNGTSRASALARSILSNTLIMPSDNETIKVLNIAGLFYYL
jgi:hypothetical protein